MLWEGSFIKIIFVYAKNTPRERALLWRELAEKSENLIIMGDFNMVELREDRYKRKGVKLSGLELENWMNLIHAISIQEIDGQQGFTWSNNQDGNDLRMERLDRGYISQGLRATIPLLSLELWVISSSWITSL